MLDALAKVLLVPGAALLFAPAPADRPRAESRAGQKIERTIVHEDKSVLAAVELTVAGEARTVDAAKGMLETSSTDRFVLEDAIEKDEAGRATSLRRRFRELESASRLTAREGDKEKVTEEPRESPLAGLEVEFTREADAETWKRSWVGRGTEDALLEDLRPEVDFAGWLPGREVSEGDTWKLSAEVYTSTVLRPAGHLHFDTDPPRPEQQKELQEALFGKFEGELVATWKGVREEQGRKLGVIAVAGEVRTAAEIDLDGAQGVEALAIAMRSEIEAELLWDLDGRHAHALELSGRGSYTRTETGQRKVQEREVEVAREMRFDTEDSWKVSFEVQ
jgi:hypothetical protein